MEVNRSAVSSYGNSQILVPNEESTRIDDDHKKEQPVERAHLRITARNLSELSVNRINVYASGREEPILGTNFYGDYDKHHYASTFFSSVAFSTPYSIKAIVDRNGDCYSGELEITRSGHLDIDIDKKNIVMNEYADRDKTTLIASTTLTPTFFRPEQGNHPLV